ncbi:MAG: glycogen/starch/alpha-glucan family phosphorylase, partial [Eubacteriales bacterium]|nr:glycogen/starch/alpha-glucan family phosphorylase [Eubacteriales bacterium]
MGLSYTSEEMTELIQRKLLRFFGREPSTARIQEIYKATCLAVRDIMSELKLKNHDEVKAHQQKEIFYLSMEFLPGASLHNNVFNLGMEEVIRESLAQMGRNLDDLYALEPDAGLGNGGLGRLASCYLDAIATLGMAGHGMSICYEYGIFKQKILDGKQVELPDDWLDLGEIWLLTKEDEIKEVHFGGELKEIWDDKGEMELVHTGYTTVLAIPQDMLITGYDSQVVNTLRLWKSTSPISIDMELFAQGKYLQAMEQKHMAEVISKILYPEDAHREGKSLRIMQQYFFISASMQTIVKRHFAAFGTLDNFNEKVGIHINDTHPTMAIPELLRILIDEYGYRWDPAWKIVSKSVSYTNHTIMPEALEQWPEDLFAKLLPRIHSIVWEINRRQNVKLSEAFPFEEGLRKEMAVIHDGKLRMANLCVETAHTVNGVSALHSRIISQNLFRGFHRMSPEKFTNVTNGIA